jgi:hypothetical protein
MVSGAMYKGIQHVDKIILELSFLGKNPNYAAGITFPSTLLE